MAIIFFQSHQHREELNFQSVCPNRESTDQGSSANVHTQEEAHMSELTVLTLLLFVFQTTAEILKISVLHIRNGFYW